MFIRLNVPPRSGHQITSDGVLCPWRPGQFQRSHRRRSIAPSPPFTPSIPHLSHTRSIVASCAVSKARPRTSQRTGAGGITVLLRRAAYRPHVDAGRMHGDQHLTGDGKRRLDVVGRKNILAAEAVDARLNRRSPWFANQLRCSAVVPANTGVGARNFPPIAPWLGFARCAVRNVERPPALT
jgi:hypothetical protein